jgi:hypothetical protein
MEHDQVEAWAKNQAYISLGNLMTICAQGASIAVSMEVLSAQVDEL